MWMMGYNDGGGEYSKQDSFNTRKLRPLVPRPISSSTNNIPSSTLPSLTRTLHGTDFFSLNHHMDQSKRELNTQPAVVVSSRWNPTPEQLRTLEELYRRGTRTPSADQIQHITAQLRRYGKIEGKNVFYWFQNHKARERQKRRRQMDVPVLPHEHNEAHERKESGSSRTSSYEGGQTKNWSPSTNCSTLAEESAPSKQKETAGGGAAAVLAPPECRRPDPNGWIQQFDPDPFEKSFNTERNATWQMMTHHHLIINNSTTTSNTTPSIASPSGGILLSKESPATKRTTMLDLDLLDPNNNNRRLVEARELMNIFIASSSSCSDNGGGGSRVINGGGGPTTTTTTSHSQTLQLFPVQSSINVSQERERQLLLRDKDSCSSNNSRSIINTTTTTEANCSNLANSFQFYEFLPLKH